MNLLFLTSVLPQYHFYISLGVTLLILTLTISLRKICRRAILRLFKRIKFETPTVLDSLNKALNAPLDYFILMTGIYFSILCSPFVRMSSRPVIPLYIGASTRLELNFISSAMLHTCYRYLLIVLGTWALYNLVNVYEEVLTSIGSKFTLLDNTLLIRFTVKILRFLIIVIGIAILANEIFNLTAIITSIGIAGAALTLVAKDTLTNILSGILLMVDKPFAIGDWIQVGALEGIVEDVSFRSTRIRSFTQGIVIVPNSNLSKDHIINWSAMAKRKAVFDIGLTYNSPSTALQECIKEIASRLKHFEAIESDTVLVYFNQFAPSSLSITISYFSFYTDLARFAKLKEEVNFCIIETINKYGLVFAFPTQTIVLDQLPPS